MSETRSFRKILDGPFSYTSRPEPVAGDLRMSWGMAILLLSLLNSRSGKANFQKLQFLAHAVRIPEGREEVRLLLRGKLRPSDVSVRVEPWLNRAVSYAFALKLVKVEKGKSVSLTPKGADAAKLISGDREALAQERNFLEEVAPRLTDTLLTKIWRMEEVQ